jgi:hypothetical protein
MQKHIILSKFISLITECTNFRTKLLLIGRTSEDMARSLLTVMLYSMEECLRKLLLIKIYLQKKTHMLAIRLLDLFIQKDIIKV